MVHWPAQSLSSPLGVITIHNKSTAIIPRGQKPSWGKDLGLIPPLTLLFFLINSFVLIHERETLFGSGVNGKMVNQGVTVHILPVIPKFKNNHLATTIIHIKPMDLFLFQPSHLFLYVLGFEKDLPTDLNLLRADFFG